MKSKVQITFDTLEYMEELTGAGIPTNEAEAMTRATSRAFSQAMETQELATKKDLIQLETRMQKFFIKSSITSVTVIATLLTIFHLLNKWL